MDYWSAVSAIGQWVAIPLSTWIGVRAIKAQLDASNQSNETAIELSKQKLETRWTLSIEANDIDSKREVTTFWKVVATNIRSIPITIQSISPILKVSDKSYLGFELLESPQPLQGGESFNLKYSVNDIKTMFPVDFKANPNGEYYVELIFRDSLQNEYSCSFRFFPFANYTEDKGNQNEVLSIDM
ncbi:hypothetical protein MK805_15305 [Shimazuella sp. AN120528]|uniref:hypothetical protein n=1 Tax=Shimazuella soli TaxID=1892854 RepID=UPI001F0FEF24|nr:hypothetical protein [Shimazuella soli]MCH5586309.1 hypothetical protein [Shimazuella soli]